MAGAHAIVDHAPAVTPFRRGSGDGSPPPPSITERMFRRLRASKHPQDDNGHIFPPKPVQLALPLLGGMDPASLDDHPLSAAPLFREARRIEPVLSYERASLEQIMPGAEQASDMPHDRLILPGGTGLVLHVNKAGAMACDWMQWGRKGAEPWKEDGSENPGATIDAQDLRKGARRVTRHRCIVPLTRYSVPVRDGAIWSHRWIASADGPIACIAGVYTAERGTGATFAMVTGFRAQDEGGPLILSEDELTLWLRAPLGDALTIISERRTRAESSAER